MNLRRLVTIVALLATSPQLYGFNFPTWDNPSLSASVQKAELTHTHSTYVRIPISMQYGWPTQSGGLDWGYVGHYYNIYNDLRANGQTPIFLVMGTPYWALTPEGKGAWKGSVACLDNNNATTCNAPPNVRDPQVDAAWRQWVATLAFYMPDAVYEIWNEPNLDWSWIQPQDPELYALMLKSAKAQIRVYDPNTKVISGGISNYEGQNTSAETDMRSFLQTIYDVAGKDSFDGIGYHAYPCNFQHDAAGWTEYPNRITNDVRHVRDMNTDSAKPLWLTETGATTGAPSASNCGTSFTEDEQASALTSIIDWAKDQQMTYGDMPAVLIHNLFDYQPRPADPTSPPAGFIGSSENEFGLIAYTIDPDTGQTVLHPKPALDAVACAFAPACGP